MLLKKEKLNETTYELQVSFEGEKYNNALTNYSAYVQEIFRDSYENSLFPKGKTPIEVNEELHGDGLYREIIKKHFISLYYEAIEESEISNANLEKVEFEYFSREKIVFTLTVSTLNCKSEDETKHITDALNSELDHISNVDKLRINARIKRDEHFWKDLNDVCVAYQQNISQELTPILSKLGVLNYGGDAIQIDINDSNPMRSLYPVIEIALYPCAVFSAALHEYIQDFTSEDERNLKKYIFSTANELLEMSDQLGGNIKNILTGRLNEYSLACKNEWLSGLSLYGQFGMDFDGLKGWSQSHQVKCAHILCDHIAYIKHFHELGSYEDLGKLKPIVVNNSEQTLRIYMELFNKLHITSGAIFMIVRGALNGGRKVQWRAEGLCQYCGREFKKSLFGSKCPVCKIKKDY